MLLCQMLEKTSGKNAHAQQLEEQRNLNREANPVPPAVSLQWLLLTKVITCLWQKEIFNGPRSILKEQAKRLHWELRSNQSITGKAYI